MYIKLRFWFQNKNRGFFSWLFLLEALVSIPQDSFLTTLQFPGKRWYLRSKSDSGDAVLGCKDVRVQPPNRYRICMILYEFILESLEGFLDFVFPFWHLIGAGVAKSHLTSTFQMKWQMYTVDFFGWASDYASVPRLELTHWIEKIHPCSYRHQSMLLRYQVKCTLCNVSLTWVENKRR